MKDDRVATVYVLYGEDDVVLYVGMTIALSGRLAVHSKRSPWWNEVVRAQFHHVGTKYQARRSEAWLIRDLEPRYNQQRAADVCRVCLWEPAVTHGRCRSCDQYHRRTGEERPEELIVRHAQRLVEREAMANRSGSAWDRGVGMVGNSKFRTPNRVRP